MSYIISLYLCCHIWHCFLIGFQAALHVTYYFDRGFLARRLFRKMLEQVKREEEEVRQLSAEVAKISDMIYKIQLEHIEFDKERHRKKVNTQCSIIACARINLEITQL